MTARILTEGTDFLGMCSDDTASNDRSDIQSAADALASLVKRHSTERDTAHSHVPVQNEAFAPEDDHIDSPALSRLRRLPRGISLMLLFGVSALLCLALILSALIAITAALAVILMIIGVTVSGMLLFFVGIVYGVSQLQLFRAAGFFEIGMGLTLGGIATLLTVLLFNTVKCAIPKLFRMSRQSIKSALLNIRQLRRKI